MAIALHTFDYALNQTAAPAVEPVSLDDARIHCRVDDLYEDDLISTLIAAARQYAETRTSRALVNQTWQLMIDAFPPEIVVPKPPLSSVSSIVYTDTDGASQTLGASVYSVDTAIEPGRIRLAFEQSWPVTRAIENVVTVTFVAGYGAAAADVPEAIIVAMKMMVGHWYENREHVRIGGGAAVVVPDAVNMLLDSHRIIEAV